MHNPSDSIDSYKQALRKSVLQSLKDYPFKKEESEKIAEMLSCNEMFRSSDLILAFHPLRTEPDVQGILKDKIVAYPYITDGRMHFSISDRFIIGKLGFLEPEIKEPIAFSHAVMLVPLVAFNENNIRLGRGGGFYDRFIQENRTKLYTIGLGFSPSFQQGMAAEEHDAILDEIIAIKTAFQK